MVKAYTKLLKNKNIAPKCTKIAKRIYIFGNPRSVNMTIDDDVTFWTAS